jgi:hypothetical protein
MYWLIIRSPFGLRASLMLSVSTTAAEAVWTMGAEAALLMALGR